MKTLILIALIGFVFAARANDKIVGGVEAAEGEFPFMVSLQYDGHFCGGSLVGSHWVLTAAHCAGSVQGLSVFMGSNRLDSDKATKLSVSKIIVHPKFDSNKLDFDFALVRLSEDVSFQPVSLNETEMEVPNDLSKSVTTAGWGLTQENGFDLPVQLMKVDVPLITKSACEDSYKGMITDQMICAGLPEGGKDSCQGDSGGPLFAKDSEGQFKLIGVVSWGIGCARPDKYGVYSKVNSVINWIKAETAK